VYRLACTQEEYEALLPGQKLRVTGYKTKFSGEPELTDATFSVLEGTFLSEPVAVPDSVDADGGAASADPSAGVICFSGKNVLTPAGS